MKSSDTVLMGLQLINSQLPRILSERESHLHLVLEVAVVLIDSQSAKRRERGSNEQEEG